MIRHASLHRGGHAQGLVDANKVVVHGGQSEGTRVVLYFLAEPVGQSGVAPVLHPDAQIKALHIRCGDMLRFRLADDALTLGAYYYRRTVAALPSGDWPYIFTSTLWSTSLPNDVLIASR